LDYEISKYAGYFPVTNELLDDSDANIASTLIAWIGDESRVTRNKLILEALDAKEKTALEGLDDIKKALNVTLGQAFKPTSKIITNDDGLQYLDTLKDSMGRDLLQPDPTEPANMRLRAGATVVPIKVIPNADMPSNTSEAGKRIVPMIIGDLKEAVKFFDRKQLTIMTSNIAAVGELNAFEEDLTLYRAIEREDVQTKDLEAVVYGEITLADESVTGE
jgi:HK97 family phage major capsid protein